MRIGVRQGEWDVGAVAVEQTAAAAMLRLYFAEMVGRYHGREATAAEVDAAVVEDPGEDLCPPHGVFLLARHGRVPAGCAGVRLLSPGVAEMKRVFVHPARRRRGGGAVLVEAVEQAARGLGARVVRLDTRGDLVEARRLYARCGYTGIPAYSHGPYAEHWYEKRLSAG